jgi:hypothetical protein
MSAEFWFMNGDPSAPQLGSFNATAPERFARVAEVGSAYPGAVANVITKQKARIVSACERGERCFTVGRVNADCNVIEAQTYAAALLPRVHGGKLAKDKEFTRYVADHDTRRHHPIYVFLPDGGFLAVVMNATTLLGASIEDVLMRDAAAGAAAADIANDPEKKAAFRKLCMNTLCGARDVPMFTCSRCKEAWYCSKDCQKKDWKMHKLFCKNAQSSK